MVTVGAVAEREAVAPGEAPAPPVLELEGVSVSYGPVRAVRDVSLAIRPRAVTAFIGASGCGKTSVLRALNRMHDLTRGARVEGRVCYRGVDVYGPGVDPVEVRRRIGMVFQKPNPLPASIHANVAYGLKVAGVRRGLDDAVEQALHRAGLWEEVKDRLRAPALSLSGGQQQRLCIARALATEPEVLLMDEPCSALDPVATARIEALLESIKQHHTVVIVTHNMQQAARVSDVTAFFSIDPDSGAGVLVEVAPTGALFTRPRDPRTEDYITGRVG
jgi:phosphate transport system ATP-binding protein